MTSNIDKFLKKLSSKERKRMEEIRQKIIKKDLSHLDIKPLKGYPDFARVRMGKYRIIFRGMKTGEIRIVKITKRDDNTYS